MTDAGVDVRGIKVFFQMEDAMSEREAREKSLEYGPVLLSILAKHKNQPPPPAQEPKPR